MQSETKIGPIVIPTQRDQKLVLGKRHELSKYGSRLKLKISNFFMNESYDTGQSTEMHPPIRFVIICK